jgi:hypothetical protein
MRGGIPAIRIALPERGDQTGISALDDDGRESESRMVLAGLLIVMAVAGLILLVTALVGHGVAGG